ncbi:type VII secretion protein EccCb [Tengunoibacter tsumagoiensis]|uniref:Type VII secretion protein EccC n=1 Tax=Tengunoibacter tsumagoiensis TaxID=2014871 RepID=A0A401ZUS0_9CHLR|nr:type VII secretion protein EccCb [Tengunoibacter tsumagoiensis]GCE10536.1 type VII secretion protein EccC [Tengunoibacter tsumagoiensis]
MHGTKFYRPARAYTEVLPSEQIVILAPPMLVPAQSGFANWMQFLMPVVGSMGSMVFMFAYRSNPLMIVAGVTMMICSIGGGIGMGIVRRSTQKRQTKQNSELYCSYLAQSRTRLRTIETRQRQVSTRLYPPYPQLAQQVHERLYLWERRPEDADFLDVRIGLGPVPLVSRVMVGVDPNPMVQYMPELKALADSLVNEYLYLDDMPASIALRNVGVLTICGERARTRSLLHAIICQILAFQSPEDVRCLAYFPVLATRQWSWLKWAPHVRRLRQIKAEKKNAPDPLCLLANSTEELRDLLQQQIKPELDRRRRLLEDREKSQQLKLSDVTRPHIILAIDGFLPHGPLAQIVELDDILQDAARLGVTVICLVDEISHEPAQVHARLSISSVGRLNYEELHLGGRRLESLLPDTIERRICEQIARSLAPLSLGEANAQQDLARDVRLLDLLKFPSADTLHARDSWKPRERADLLRVPLGVRADGEPLILDLKEAADKGMGPHGLVVGATGSGKSELLRTMIISLAVTHDPQMVNFVLIDFKGGASFADFAALPHVAGIITNLQGDLTLVDRVYNSLLGEQQRRQRMLHEAGNLDNIKQYQAKWRLTPDMEPMPHLVIIADEFAELIANRPDFLDLFVTMGRVGRSLGIHLLFATQRIEEGRIRGLEGHLRYRICLRTFSASESSSVLGKPDAYYLPSAPGIGYFKVDTDTYHMFKTALISLPFVPVREQASPLTRIRDFTATGKLVKHQPQVAISSIATAIMAEEPSDLHTEMDVVIGRLAASQTLQQAQSVHQVWLPPLSKALPLYEVLDRLEGRGTNAPFGLLNVPLGLLDLPLLQAQEPLWLDFSGSGGHLALVGAPQTGKSTFLRTLVTSFMLTHTPRDVQLYCIDLGGGLLRVFEAAPHVGVVCGKSDRDKVRRVIRQMRKIIEDREFLFREHSIDSMNTFRTRRQAGELSEIPFGDVFLIIDNFALFVQEFDMETEIAELIANGLTYGVHIILATNRWAEIRTKLRDNIGTRLELRLNDPSDSEFGKATAQTIPVGVPGRGINKEKLQYQVALPLVESIATENLVQVGAAQQALEAFIERVRADWKGEVAPPIRLLPPLVKIQELPEPSAEQPAGIPLGLEEFRLDPISIDLIGGGPHFMILGDSESGKTTLLRTWMRGIEQRYTPDQVKFAIIDYRKMLVDFVDSKHLLTYVYNPQTLAECLGNFQVDLQKRMKTGADQPLNKLRTVQRWSGRHYFLFIDDYDSLSNSPSTSPIGPLVDFLLSGRDIGFHVIIARRVGGMSRAAFESAIQRLREMGTAALVMSGDPQEGRIMHGIGATQLPAGRGYLVQPKQPPTLVQIAYSEPAYTTEAEV